MKKLKTIIYSNIGIILSLILLISMVILVPFNIMMTHRQARNDSETIFLQVKQILDENNEEIKQIKESYRETCLLNAETVAKFVKLDPKLLEYDDNDKTISSSNAPEYLDIAKKLQIDEIHIFDSKGRIIAGSHPEYYYMSLYSGEQMSYFLPLLNDETKSLKIVQDITPNTAEAKLVQYSALWSDDGNFIVQIGMYPDTVLAATKKNELSYIFSLLKGNTNATLYAIDGNSKTLVGTNNNNNDKLGISYNELGLSTLDINVLNKAEHEIILGTRVFCQYEVIDDVLIVYAVNSSYLYNDMISFGINLLITLLVIFIAVVIILARFTNKYVTSSIEMTNNKLSLITNGNLEERVDVNTCKEFANLSSYINKMVKSLLANTDQLRAILKVTNLKIGLYEYDDASVSVKVSDNLSQVLGIDDNKLKDITSDINSMDEFISDIKTRPDEHMESVYAVDKNDNHFIKLEEVKSDSTVIGIFVDVTNDIFNMRRAEKDSTVDALTGMLNRRGVEAKFKEIQAKHSSTLTGAIFVIDLDDMKYVNDTFGHLSGDTYLKSFSLLLDSISVLNHIVSRVGGDEFVLVVYSESDDSVVDEAISYLRNNQDSIELDIGSNSKILAKFSFGYQEFGPNDDYNRLFAVADEYMYISKRLRKKTNSNEEVGD